VLHWVQLRLSPQCSHRWSGGVRVIAAPTRSARGPSGVPCFCHVSEAVACCVRGGFVVQRPWGDGLGLVPVLFIGRSRTRSGR
jgi:hypothetical protein